MGRIEYLHGRYGFLLARLCTVHWVTGACSLFSRRIPVALYDRPRDLKTNEKQSEVFGDNTRNNETEVY